MYVKNKGFFLLRGETCHGGGRCITDKFLPGGKIVTGKIIPGGRLVTESISHATPVLILLDPPLNRSYDINPCYIFDHISY